MTVHADPASSVLDRIKRTLVGLRMPRALEMIDATVRQLERGEVSPLEAIETLLAEEFSIRENRRVKTALMMARLSTVKTLAGFDFAFQPSLDRNRVLALAQLDFVDRHEVVHLLGPPGTGKSHLAIALGVEAVKAGRSVYFVTLADLVASLAKAEREGRLRDRIRFFCRAAFLIVDEIGYLPVVSDGGNLFFQLVNCQTACNIDPRLECAPGTGQVRSSELTGVPGFRKKTHGKAASIPQRRVQAPGRRGVPRWRDPAWSGEAARPVPQSDPRLGREVRGRRLRRRRRRR